MALLAGDALFPLGLGFHHIVTHTPTHLLPRTRHIQVSGRLQKQLGPPAWEWLLPSFLTLRMNGNNAFDLVQEKKFGEMGQCSAACDRLRKN
ncbi:UNVERIFIED_CONTAM: Heterodimeric geranylgeranyl pyrophosphate synthase small subunit, chloroplastic [Sesamum latifolium]|uniref:Heterodimeric geranylgeranyl pyrophosphate synthase small subunit, chloroplastic n=1 Tax=Sesamum latifolium TaxID=2727402 RepID=A0AAW2V5Y3_9LAMI